MVNDRIVIVISCALCLLASGARAARVEELKPGDRIRILKSGSYKRFELKGISGGVMTVKARKEKEAQQLSLSEIGGMEVMVRKSTGHGMVKGAIIGGVAGAVVGGIIGIARWNDPETNCGPLDDVCEGTASAAQLIGAIGICGITGIALGLVIGAAAPGMEWERVDIPLTLGIGPGPGRGLCLQYSASF